jgi:hypothetical protein
MGYRSDVTALIYPDGGEHSALNYNKLKLLMNTTFKELFDEWGGVREFSDGWEWNDDVLVLQFTATSVKWYDSYPDVQRFVKFLGEVQELEYQYEFMRVGEEDTDIEYDSTGDAQGYLSVRREIEVSF